MGALNTLSRQPTPLLDKLHSETKPAAHRLLTLEQNERKAIPRQEKAGVPPSCSSPTAAGYICPSLIGRNQDKTWACGTDLWKRPHSSEMGIWTGSVLNVSEMTELPEDKRKQPAYFWRLLFWPRGLPNNWHQTIGTVLITDDRNSMRKKTEPSNILSALQCHRCVTHQLWKCFLWAVISRKRTENI